MFTLSTMPTHDKVSPERIRRRWFNIGCDTPRLARELGISRQAAHATIQRVNASNPIVSGKCDPLDQAALNRSARLLLHKHGATVPGLDTDNAPAI